MGQSITNARYSEPAIQADGSDTRQDNLACVVMTADCLPVLFCDQSGEQIAAVHAGWRGLAGGILHKTVQRFQNPEKVMVLVRACYKSKAF